MMQMELLWPKLPDTKFLSFQDFLNKYCMIQPTPRTLEQPLVAEMRVSIGSRLVEQVINHANDLGRSKRSRELALKLLLEFQERGNKLN